MEKSCPTCGSPMWDNRRENAERIAQGLKARPEFVCKSDRNHVIWPPKGKARRALPPQPVSEYPLTGSPWTTAPQTREPIDEWQPGQTQAMPEKTSQKVWDEKDLRIARESALASVSRVLTPVQDPVAAAGIMIEAADILVDYIYNGIRGKEENVSDAELTQAANEIFK